jgi:hypothetical protein
LDKLLADNLDVVKSLDAPLTGARLVICGIAPVPTATPTGAPRKGGSLRCSSTQGGMRALWLGARARLRARPTALLSPPPGPSRMHQFLIAPG